MDSKKRLCLSHSDQNCDLPWTRHSTAPECSEITDSKDDSVDSILVRIVIFREYAIPEWQNVRRRQGSRFRENARLQGDEAQRSVLSLSRLLSSVLSLHEVGCVQRSYKKNNSVTLNQFFWMTQCCCSSHESFSRFLWELLCKRTDWVSSGASFS